METEKRQTFDEGMPQGAPAWALLRSARFLIPATVCVLSLVAVPMAFVAGAIVGNTQIYQNFSDQQQRRIEEFLTQNSDSFRHLRIEHASNGWAYPIGAVSSQSDYDLLANNLHRMFGDELAERMLVSVTVESEE